MNLAIQIGDDEIALLAARRLRALAPKDPGRRAVEMELLAGIGKVREALSASRRLESDQPADARWPLLAGTYHTRLGAREEAISALHRATRRSTAPAVAWEQLAGLKTFTSEDPDFEAVKHAAADAARKPDGAALAYAYAKICDDVGDVDRAFEWYQRGAALSRGGRMPRMDAFLAQAADARAAFPAGRLVPANATDRAERPILIIGCPRSGTTLLERIVASSDKVAPGGELKMLRLACLGFSPPSPVRVESFVQRSGGERQAWADVADIYVRKLVQRFGRADRVTDKGLVNYLYLGALALALPRAHIIHVRRDPMDVAWSCFRRRFHQGLAWSYHFDSIAAFLRVYQDLMDHWHNVLPERILPVDYEALVQDPDAQTQRVFDFIGVPRPETWHLFHEAKGAILTASQIQVRRPLNAEGVGAWRRYERFLGPLREALSRYGVRGVN
jgi:hypothetical protein